MKILRRENHVLEVREDCIKAWLKEVYANHCEEDQQPSVITVERDTHLGWIILSSVQIGYFINDARINLECIKDALNMTEIIEDRGVDLVY